MGLTFLQPVDIDPSGPSSRARRALFLSSSRNNYLKVIQIPRSPMHKNSEAKSVSFLTHTQKNKVFHCSRIQGKELFKLVRQVKVRVEAKKATVKSILNRALCCK